MLFSNFNNFALFGLIQSAQIDKKAGEMVKTRNKAEKENAFESKSLARKKTQRLRMVPVNRQPLVEKEDDGNMKPSSTFLAENGPNNNSRSKREKLVIENDKGEEAGIVLVSDDLSDYEKVRLKNIAERQKMFENLKKDMMSLKKDMTAPNSGKPKQSHIVARRRRGTSLGYSSRAERVVTRSRTSLGSSEVMMRWSLNRVRIRQFFYLRQMSCEFESI